MKQLMVAGAVALLASAGTASAQTKTLSGDRGYGRVNVGNASFYLADKTFVVRVQQDKSKANTGIMVRPGPSGAVWRGGTVIGTGINRTHSWSHVHGASNGACLIYENHAGFTVERLRGSYCWDGIRPAGKAQGWVHRWNWLDNIRDDAIAENDHCWNGRVERNLIENVHTIYSARPGKGSGDSTKGTNCKHTLEFIGNVISMGKHLEDRAKRIEPHSNIEGGKVMQSGQFFKVSGEGAGARVVFRDNVIMTDHAPGAAKSKLRLIPRDWQILPGSGNNTFIWLGAGNIKGLSYEKIDGCSVPREFEIPRNLFRVLCGAAGRQAWEVARAKWLDEVWEGKPQPTPEPEETVEASPPEPTDPGPSDPDPAEPDPTEPAATEPPSGGSEILVAVDVRPMQCPNRVTTRMNRNIPVVIAGTDSFDVRDIDARSVRLAGVEPKHHRTAYRDRVAPFEPVIGKKDPDDCARDGGDGLVDLLLRFSSKDLSKALGPLAKGGVAVAPLTGKLLDGTPILGQDVIVVF